MRIRGDRTCRDCGATWSYFETGSVACPECGSMRSSGSGDRSRHTDGTVELDLEEPRSMAAEGDLEDAVREASPRCLEYIRQRGFVDGGALLVLDDEYVHAQELRHAAVLLPTHVELRATERSYLLALLEADSDRPAVERVPDRFRSARGLGIAAAVRDYRDELRTWLDDQPDRSAASGLLESLGERVKRIQALDGEVPPSEAADLLRAGRATGRYCRDGDEESLETARSMLAADR